MMQINRTSGLIAGVSYCPSEFCDARPANTDIELLVIHGISMPEGHFGGNDIEALFTGTLDFNKHPSYAKLQGLRVASHIVIRRDGQVQQFVPFHRRAWHAGLSSFQGREKCNDFSIGIECEGTDTLPYETVQYQQLAEIIRALMAVYPKITQERIVAHAMISPGRRSDPGEAFDWTYLWSCLQKAEY